MAPHRRFGGSSVAEIFIFLRSNKKCHFLWKRLIVSCVTKKLSARPILGTKRELLFFCIIEYISVSWGWLTYCRNMSYFLTPKIVDFCLVPVSRNFEHPFLKKGPKSSIFGVPVRENLFWQNFDRHTPPHQIFRLGPSPSTFYGLFSRKRFHNFHVISAVNYPENPKFFNFS